MACEGQGKLMDFVLEELSPSEAREVELHVAQCGDCAHSLAGLREMRAVLTKQFSDSPLPSHLVFLPEREAPQPTGPLAGFLESLWRTAALAAVAGAVFLGIVLGGYARWAEPGRKGASGASMTQAWLSGSKAQAIIDRAVEKAAAEQKKDLRAASDKLAADLRADQARGLERVARRMEFLESAQNAVWKETQQQGVLVELVARNSLRGQSLPQGKP